MRADGEAGEPKLRVRDSKQFLKWGLHACEGGKPGPRPIHPKFLKFLGIQVWGQELGNLAHS